MLGALIGETGRGFLPVVVGASHSESLRLFVWGSMLERSRLSSGNGFISLVLTGFFCEKAAPGWASGVVTGRGLLEMGYGSASTIPALNEGAGLAETLFRFCVLEGIAMALCGLVNGAAYVTAAVFCVLDGIEIALCGPVKTDSGGGVLVFCWLAGIEIAEVAACACICSFAEIRWSPPGMTNAAFAFDWLSQGAGLAV